MSSLTIDVVSAENEIYSGEATFVSLPGEQGDLGIYPNHAPLITKIKPGVVTIKKDGSDDETIFVAGGILEVQQNLLQFLQIQLLEPRTLTKTDYWKHKRKLKKNCQNLKILNKLPQLKMN